MVKAEVERALVALVHLLHDRWHGNVDWPPSPFRFFQALIAGAYGGRWCSEGDSAAADEAFLWLEALQPPTIGAPAWFKVRSTQYWVPNNDLDAVGHDPRRTGDIRTQKILRSRMFDGLGTFAYAWRFPGSERNAVIVSELCERLHTFGRGIDAAYATAEIVDASEIDTIFRQHMLRRSDPTMGAGSLELPCPEPGSLRSLQRRFQDSQRRFIEEKVGRQKTTRFRQPEKGRSRTIAYDVRPARLLFEIQRIEEDGRLYPVRVELASRLTTAVRDLAFTRLSSAMQRVEEFERVILGRGSDDRHRPSRIRFVGLPSIGTRHTDPSIRRVLVEIPPDCPLEASDLRWALAGQRLPSLLDTDGTENAAVHARLVDSGSTEMLWGYGIFDKCERWRTITPAVLPVRLRAGRHSGSVRAQFENIAALSVADAIRHAGIDARVREVTIQREPFDRLGKCADDFDSDRFAVGRLRHVEILFDEPVSGPLLIGDGRWLGLGLMRPVRSKKKDVRSADEPDVGAVGTSDPDLEPGEIDSEEVADGEDAEIVEQ